MAKKIMMSFWSQFVGCGFHAAPLELKKQQIMGSRKGMEAFPYRQKSQYLGKMYRH